MGQTRLTERRPPIPSFLIREARPQDIPARNSLAEERSSVDAATVINLVLLVAILGSVFVGFRWPNVWSQNYWQFSIVDGFYRRSMLGTLLDPFGCLRFSYRELAVLQTAVSVLSVGLLVSGCKGLSRLYLAAVLIGPFGPYMMHLNGYVDFVILAGLPLLLRWVRSGAIVAPAVLTSFLVLCHELALVTAVPLATFAALRYRGVSAALWTVGPGILVAALAMAAPIPSMDAVGLHVSKAAMCGNLLSRQDYIADVQLAGQLILTEIQYSISEIVILILVTVFVSYVFSRYFDRWIAVVGAAAALAPLLLGLAGWDTSRWVLLSALQIVLIISCSPIGADLSLARRADVALPLLFAAILSLASPYWFDDFKPRTLDRWNSGAWRFVDEIGTFAQPLR